MSLPIAQTKEQILAVARECMLTMGIDAGGAPRFWHTEEMFPYFTVRTGADTVGFDSQDFDRDIYTFTLRLVVGHLTSGYKGEREAELDDWLPALKTYLNEHQLLQSPAFPDPITGLIEARCTGHTGFNAFPNSGLPVIEIGTDFTIECQYDETITQAYN